MLLSYAGFSLLSLLRQNFTVYHIYKNCEGGAPAFELVAGNQHSWNYYLVFADEGTVG